MLKEPGFNPKRVAAKRIDKFYDGLRTMFKKWSERENFEHRDLVLLINYIDADLKTKLQLFKAEVDLIHAEDLKYRDASKLWKQIDEKESKED